MVVERLLWQQFKLQIIATLDCWKHQTSGRGKQDNDTGHGLMGTS